MPQFGLLAHMLTSVIQRLKSTLAAVRLMTLSGISDFLPEVILISLVEESHTADSAKKQALACFFAIMINGASA